MQAAEFQARIVDGKIEIPPSIRDRFQGQVSVILFTEGTDWPEKNQRRWALIAKKVRQGLTDTEAAELSALQCQADEQLNQIGPRPVEELELFYTQLTDKE
jgi:hypothetical protein